MKLPNDTQTLFSFQRPILIFTALIAAGLAGNYYGYELFFNIHFIFGSIFSLLVLQLFGLRWGVLAAALISTVTYVLWNHPYAIIIMTGEVAVVGLVSGRRKLDLVLADTLYWVCIGFPLIFLFYSGVMHLPLYTTEVTMVKQALNGIANALAARLAFMAVSSSFGRARFPLHELFFDLLAFAVLATSLFLLISMSRSELLETDRAIRGSLGTARQRITTTLENKLAFDLQTVVYLAGAAEKRPPAAMQLSIEQAHAMHNDFIRIGLLDRQAVIVAISPLGDESGNARIGRSYADRPFIPTLKRTLKPMFSDVELARIGAIGPRVALLAPVVSRGQYAGYVIGVLDLGRLQEPLAQSGMGQMVQGLRFTLVDRGSRVIVTNRSDLKIMDVFNRGAGEQRQLGEGISQWLPAGKVNVALSDSWKNSSYIAEQAIGIGSEWRMVLELPIAPVQRKLSEKYAAYLTEIFIVLLIALTIARLLSRRAAASLERLAGISSRIPATLSSIDALVWPESSITETGDLIHSFRDMAQVMAIQFHKIRTMNEKLEQLINERTEELRESEERFRSLFEKVPVVALVIDPADGSILDANTAASAFYGWSRDELRAKKISAINTLSPDEVNREMEAARNAHRSYFLFQHRRADSSIRDVEVYSGPVRTGGKTVLYSIIHDITERRRAEQGFLLLANEQKVILNTMASGVLYVKERSIVWVNPAFEQIFGYKTEEARGLDARKLYADVHDFDRVGNEGYARLAQGESYTIEVMAVKKDGSTFWLNLTGRAVDPNRPAEGSIWQLQDITGRKQAQEALRQAEERLSLALKASGQGIYDLDLTTGETIVTPEYALMLGYDPAEFHETNAQWIERLHPDDREAVTAVYRAYVKGERSEYKVEFRQKTKEGTWKWILSLGKIMERNAAGDPLRMIGTHTDITERKQAELDLQEKTLQLVNLTQSLEDRVQKEIVLRYKSEQTLVQQSKLAAMGEMLGAISHQWRQPLNALGLIVQNLKDAHSFGDLNEEYVEQAVQKAMSQIQHMSKTIDDFRHFFLPDKEKTLFDTMLAVGEVLSLLSAQLSENDIDFRLTCSTHNKSFTRVEDIVSCREKTVKGFQNEFEHVMMNLINNAREAIVDQRERGEAKNGERGLIAFDFRIAGGKILIEVSDNGGGIPGEVVDRIFEPYFTTKDPAKGTGQGLYMSTVIVVDHMQGRLTAQNRGPGAVFTIELPQA